MPRRGVILLGLAPVALLTAPSCVRDHDILGKDPPTTSTSTSSAGGSGGSTGAGGDGGSGPVEPDGPTKLTVVNGINDYDAIRICFLSYPGGTGAGVTPWPVLTGLAFARPMTVAIDAVIPPGEDVRMHVIAGDLGAASGLDCAEILALADSGGDGGGGGGTAAPIVVAGLPVLPASVFDAERSLLVVPMGCMGGPGHTDPMEVAACGMGYTPETPTAGLAAVAMSRITEAGKIGLQVVHASAAMPIVDVRIAPAISGAAEWQVAPELSLGAIAPFPPFLSLSASEVGAVSQIGIRTYPPGGSDATSSVLMGEALGNSGLSQEDIVEGEGHVLVAVGAAPGTAGGAFWHALTYAVVKADP